MCISTPTTLYRLRRLCIHTHTHIHTHEYACSQTNTIQTDVAKDSITQSKCSEKRNVLSLFLKEGRVVECLTSWGRLFQMWRPKQKKERKPWVLRLKRLSLSMRVSDEERREREGLYTCSTQKGRRGRNQWFCCNTYRQFSSLQKSEASRRVVQCWWRDALRIRRAAAFQTSCIG